MKLIIQKARLYRCWRRSVYDNFIRVFLDHNHTEMDHHTITSMYLHISIYFQMVRLVQFDCFQDEIDHRVMSPDIFGVQERSTVVQQVQ